MIRKLWLNVLILQRATARNLTRIFLLIWFVIAGMDIMKVMIQNSRNRICMILIENHPNPREVYTNYLMENGEADAQEMANEMEKKFWDDLQERLDEVKQHPLPYKYQQPEQWWRSLRKAMAGRFYHIACNAIDEEQFKFFLMALMKWPQDFQAIKKNRKIITG